MIPVEKVMEIIDEVKAIPPLDPDESRVEIDRFVEEVKKRIMSAFRIPKRFLKDASGRAAEYTRESMKAAERDSLACLCRAVGREVCPIHKDRGAS